MDQELGSCRSSSSRGDGGGGSAGNRGGSGCHVDIQVGGETHHLLIYFADRSGYTKYNRDFKELDKSPLANGTTGVVYRCLNLYDLKEYAVKIKKDEVETKDEGEIMSQLIHPNIVQLHESWTEACFTGGEKATFISMELCQPTGFLNYMKDKSAIQEIWLIFHQILDGLHYLHFKDIVHNDLTIFNIMVGKDGNIKISDFGQGCFLGHKSEHEKMQAKSKDVYQLGQILSCMILPRNSDILAKMSYRTILLTQKMVNENLIFILFPLQRRQQNKTMSTSHIIEITDEDGQIALQLIKDVQSQKKP